MVEPVSNPSTLEAKQEDGKLEVSLGYIESLRTASKLYNVTLSQNKISHIYAFIKHLCIYTYMRTYTNLSVDEK
jgi:hypothetical protein